MFEYCDIKIRHNDSNLTFISSDFSMPKFVVKGLDFLRFWRHVKT
jgi:hypothetical protein